MLLFTRKMILFILYPAISIVALHAQKNISIQKADLLYKQGNYQGALIEYENAISYDAKNYELWLKKGDIYASLKDWSNTSKSLERVVELKKDYREGYQRLFKIYTKNGEIDKAISTLEKAYENDTDTDRKSSYKVQIITILGDNNQLEEVQKHIQDLKNLGVNHPISLYYASKYHNQMQSYQKSNSECRSRFKYVKFAKCKGNSALLL